MVTFFNRRYGVIPICGTTLFWFLALATVRSQEVRNRDDIGASRNFGQQSVSPQYLPPGTLPPNSYQLGIMARSTQTGVQISQVLPGSVAQRSGLQAGDTIINVGGYQVGYVGSRLYDLGDELARRVDRREQATLLVRKQRDGRLTNLTVQFRSTAREITGTISAPNQNNLGRQAILYVRLLDVTQSHWNDLAIAELKLNAPRTWPTSYQMLVDSANIRSGHRYAVDARVVDRGRVVLRTAAPRRVALSERGDRIDLRLIPGAQSGGGLVPYELIQQWYEKYLGRKATTREMSAWQSDLDRGQSLEDIQAGILSSTEFYDRQRNNPDRYVDEVYRQLNGVNPTTEQHRILLEQLQRQSDVRQRFTRDLLEQRQKAGTPAGNR